MSYPEPRYHGERGEISAVYRSADQKPELTIGAGTAVRYLATGASTHGQFGLYRWDAKPHTPGPAAHFHRTMSESFFVLSGVVRLYNGERWVDSKSGDFRSCPKVASMAFRMTPTNHHPCSFCFHPRTTGRLLRSHRGKGGRPEVH